MLQRLGSDLSSALDLWRQQCPRQILGICWYDHVTNDEAIQCTGAGHTLLFPIQATYCPLNWTNLPKCMWLFVITSTSLARLPDHSWRSCLGYPNIKWTDQQQDIPDDTLGNLWSATRRSHGGGAVRWSLLATWLWWRCEMSTCTQLFQWSSSRSRDSRLTS